MTRNLINMLRFLPKCSVYSLHVQYLHMCALAAGKKSEEEEQGRMRSLSFLRNVLGEKYSRIWPNHIIEIFA